MRLLFRIVLLFFLFCRVLVAQEIAVITTRSIPLVDNLLLGLKSACQQIYPLTIYDMQGDPHNSSKIVSKLKSSLEQGQVKAFFTIGLPATRLINQSLTGAPVLFSMINNVEQHGLIKNNISGISKDFPAQLLFQTIKKTLVHVQHIAIIHSREINGQTLIRYQQAAEATGINLNLYQVDSIKQVPKTLRRVITENQALILLRDKVVVNQSSLKYLLTTTLENAFPVLSYSQFLVKSGFLMGLSPDYSAMGEQAGELLCNGQIPAAKIYVPRKFELSVNTKTAKRMSSKLNPDLIQEADHVY